MTMPPGDNRTGCACGATVEVRRFRGLPPPDFPLGDALEVFIRREDAERLVEEEDAERLVEEVRGDDPEEGQPPHSERRRLWGSHPTMLIVTD